MIKTLRIVLAFPFFIIAAAAAGAYELISGDRDSINYTPSQGTE